MTAGALLVFNGGSSSLKFTLYQNGEHELPREVVFGQIERITAAPLLTLRAANGEVLTQKEWPPQSHPSDTELVAALITEIEKYQRQPLRAAGHSIVHGGPHYCQPTILDAQVLAELEASVAARAIASAAQSRADLRDPKLYPQLPQVGCFDTGLSRDDCRASRACSACRASCSIAGVVRYGFHGLSYEYIAGQFAAIDPGAARGRTVVAHLGKRRQHLRDGRWQECCDQHGFQCSRWPDHGHALRQYRSGCAAVFLLRERKLRCGQTRTAALSRVRLARTGPVASAAMCAIYWRGDDAHAREALDVFCYRVVREIGAMIAVAGGIDALIFTGGIGEHAAPIRAAICAQLAHFDLRIDAAGERAKRAETARYK